MKHNIYAEGFVTQDDINYFSLKLLENFEFISENIAIQFPIFLIDECQDTNEIKMEIMNIILNKENIKEVMFIGDYNQSIYEWNGAKPELFDELTKKYDTLELTENWRISQNICNIASKLSGTKYEAVNEKVKHYTFIPEINGYEEPDENKSEFFNNIINDFLELCKKHKIKLSKKNVAVLCKGNKLIKTINGQKEFKYEKLFIDNANITYDLIHSKFLFDHNKFNESYLKLESIIISLVLNKKHIHYHEKRKYISENGLLNIRKLCFDLINIMPPTHKITIADWISECKLKLKESDFYLKNKLLSQIKINLENTELSIEDLFNFEKYAHNYTLSTIHGSKSKTFDATLLILKIKTNKRYKNMIKDFKETGKMKEDLRNVYVAITRPRKILVIAVPKKDEKMWHEFLLDEPYREKNQSSLFEFDK